MSDVVSFLQKMTQALDTGAAAGTSAVLQFNTSKPAYITIKDSTATVTEGSAPGPDVTLIMADDDLIALLKGELNGMQAFMTGKLQLEGDMMLAQRLGTLFDASKLAG
jgi:putative sterol carrier protein